MDCDPQKRTLLDLPIEVVEQIVRELCIHCQHDNIRLDGPQHGLQRSEPVVCLGRDAFEEGRQGRAVLARLARTCKALRRIVQPVLFHFFHTGNMPRSLEEVPSGDAYLGILWNAGVKWDDLSFAPGRAEDDMLLPFLRTLLDRPDLAQHVRALALYHARPTRADPDKDTDSGLLARIQALVLQQRIAVRVDAEDDYCYGLMDVVLALTRNVEQVLLGDLVESKEIQGWSDGESDDETAEAWKRRNAALQEPMLPRLRFAAFVGVPKKVSKEFVGLDYHPFVMASVLRRAPNLATLVAHDAGNNEQMMYMHAFRYWTVPPMQHLRTLTLTGVGPELLKPLVATFPALEDLSYWTDEDSRDTFGRRPEWTMLREDHMEALYPSLRRLCYSFVDHHYLTEAWAHRAATIDESHAQWLGWNAPHRANWADLYVSFRGFQKLAILAVEHVWLNCKTGCVIQRSFSGNRTQHARDCLRDTPREDAEDDLLPARPLLDALPASLQILHLGFVINWVDLYQDLELLAKGAGTKTPLLRVIRADCVVPPPQNEVDDLTMLLAAVGIAFTVGATSRGNHIRGMLDDAPGHPHGERVPQFSYTLADVDEPK